MKPTSYKIKFLKKENIAQDTYTFYFEKPQFEFSAGQYLRIVLNNPSLVPNFHVFTISSSPTENDFLAFTTRDTKSKFKKCLLELEENSIVEIYAPLGDFILDENETRSIVFIAGGIGITPFRSILMDIKDKPLSLSIKLLISFKNKSDEIFMNELREIHSSNISIYETLTRETEENLKGWNGLIGRINSDMILNVSKSIENTCFYVCGPVGLVTDIENILNSLGIQKNNIISEKFYGYK